MAEENVDVAVVEETPLQIDHGQRVSEVETPAPADDKSELQQHQDARRAGKTPPAVKDSSQLETDAPVEEPKKPERWKDPETGDTYDMRHKVARRIKQVLEKAKVAEERANKLERERDEFKTAALGRQPTAETKPAPAVDADPEPDAADTTKYPEGQFDKAYIKDVGRWAARQETKTQMTSAKTEEQQRAAYVAETQRVQAWQTTALPEAQKRYADFGDVLAKFPNTPEHGDLIDVMLESPVGNDTVYAIGSDPKLYDAYLRAPNLKARQRLVYHVEAQLVAAARKAPTPSKDTNAPAPTAPVHAGAGPAGPTDWSKADDPDQYQRWKANRQARR